MNQKMRTQLKEAYYTVVDAVTLGKGIRRNINGFDIVFPTRYYKYYNDGYERDSFDFIRKQVSTGDVVLDIGAHIGLYAAVFGKLVGETGKVYSFEPTPITNAVLKKTIAVNHLQQVVEPRNEAVSKEKGETIFYISDTAADNSNSLVEFKTADEVHGVKINLVSIDEFCEGLQRKIDFIKIDVEGVEYDVLLGAKKVLKEQRPACILALHPNQVKVKGDSLSSIWDLVNSYQYGIFFNNTPMTKEEFCSRNDLFDVFLIPNDAR